MHHQLLLWHCLQEYRSSLQKSCDSGVLNISPGDHRTGKALVASIPIFLTQPKHFINALSTIGNDSFTCMLNACEFHSKNCIRKFYLVPDLSVLLLPISALYLPAEISYFAVY